ncbi:MAG: hypothetical protein D6698_11690, partial [Gammaproteobacteria bacterium]
MSDFHSSISHSYLGARYHLGLVALRSTFQRFARSLTGLILAGFTIQAHSAITLYTDEASYLAALNAMGVTVVTEGFENNAIWSPSRGSVINPGRASIIRYQGLVWQANMQGNGVGTDNYSSQGGSFRFYSNPHGKTFDLANQNGCDAAAVINVPASCWQNDGWTVSASQTGITLYGVGGWFNSASGAAKITYLLDGADTIPNNTNRDGTRLPGTATWMFYGVIDTSGFHTAEVREMAGKAKASQFIYGDSFSVGLTVTSLDQHVINNFTAPNNPIVGGSATFSATSNYGNSITYTSLTP